MVRMVTQTRPIVYTETRYTDGGREYQVEVGRGTEIVREESLCAKCAGVPEPEAKPAHVGMSLKKERLYDFEVRLGNGKTHKTDSPASLAMFAKLNSQRAAADMK